MRKSILDLQAGTPNFMAPEVVQETTYSTGVDIWALGCVAYEICALKPAFTSFSMNGLIAKICNGRTPLIPKAYSDEWRSVCRSMLHKDEAKRPTIQELLDLPLLQVNSLLHILYDIVPTVCKRKTIKTIWKTLQLLYASFL